MDSWPCLLNMLNVDLYHTWWTPWGKNNLGEVNLTRDDLSHVFLSQIWRAFMYWTGETGWGDGGTSGQPVYHIDGWVTWVFCGRITYSLGVAKTWFTMGKLFIHFLKVTLLTFIIHCYSLWQGLTYIRQFLKMMLLGWKIRQFHCGMLKKLAWMVSR